MGFPPVLVLLSVAVTAAVAADPPVYCQVDNNEYYVKQWGQCKACDRCPYGFGLNSKRVSFLYLSRICSSTDLIQVIVMCVGVRDGCGWLVGLIPKKK